MAGMEEDRNRKTGVKKPRVLRSVLVLAVLFTACVFILPMQASAANSVVDFNINGDSVDTLEIIEMMTVIMLAPSILIMTTCFTRIIIVLSFLRNALGVQQTPPNQVLIGISLFLTLFIMSPVLSQINTTAYEPYKAEQITQEEFVQKASLPLKEFMLKQTKTDDLNLFADMAKVEKTDDLQELPMTVVIPSFMTSELKRAFTIGFLLYIPFLVIDMIVASTLMSMGMVMLPPVMISLPFKLLLFVLVNGWDMLFKSLVISFNV